MLGVLFLAGAAVAAPPSITVSATADGFIAEAEAFDVRHQSQVDAEIERRAAELCGGGKAVRWGEFKSDVKVGKLPVTEPPEVSGFSRAFSCVTPSTRSYVAAPSDWKPSAADETAVRKAFQAYYERRDGGDLVGAKAMFAPDALASDSSWQQQMAEFNQRIGKGARRITGVTWYVNPEGAPHPGVYAAVDFIGDFAQTHFYCGYLVFFRTAEGAYEITREEQNQFERGAEPVEPVQLAQMRAAMCRGE